jgi:hypothetical protein
VINLLKSTRRSKAIETSLLHMHLVEIMLTFAGRAAETIAEDKTALRLSPRDPGRNFWQYGIWPWWHPWAAWGGIVGFLVLLFVGAWIHDLASASADPYAKYLTPPAHTWQNDPIVAPNPFDRFDPPAHAKHRHKR